MSFVLNDYECTCGWEGEELAEGRDQSFSCPECEKVLTPLPSFPNIASFTVASTERRAEILKKRSAKDTEKQISKEAERFGADGKVRATKRGAQVGYTGK